MLLIDMKNIISSDKIGRKIFRKIYQSDIEEISKAHELGTIEFIHIKDFELISNEMTVKINGDIIYYIIHNNVLLNILKKIESSYNKHIFNPLEFEVEDSVLQFKVLEVCSEYISIIFDSGHVIFCDKNDRNYLKLLTEYNVKLIE